MELNVTVPAEFQVVSSGLATKDGSTFRFRSTQPGIYGSLGIVKGRPNA